MSTTIITEASYRLLSRLISVLNTSVVLFPHVAILALLGAPTAWWFALVAAVVALYGLRRQQAAIDKAVLTEMFSAQVSRAPSQDNKVGP